VMVLRSLFKSVASPVLVTTPLLALPAAPGTGRTDGYTCVTVAMCCRDRCVVAIMFCCDGYCCDVLSKCGDFDGD